MPRKWEPNVPVFETRNTGDWQFEINAFLPTDRIHGFRIHYWYHLERSGGWKYISGITMRPWNNVTNCPFSREEDFTFSSPKDGEAFAAVLAQMMSYFSYVTEYVRDKNREAPTYEQYLAQHPVGMMA